QLSGQLSPRLFRKLPPRVCVTLKSIVDEEFLWAGHIFLGFSKCGRYVLSYTSSSGDDDFSFYLYHLYWWEFNVHSKLRLVRQVRLFQDEEIYSDLYLTVCEWPGDSDKVIVFGFNTRSAPGLQVNMMLMSDENHRDIYVSATPCPPPVGCPPRLPLQCPAVPQGSRSSLGPPPSPATSTTPNCAMCWSPGSPPRVSRGLGVPPMGGGLDSCFSRGAPLSPVSPPELEDDKISLPFVVTDLSGRSLRPLRDRATAQGQYLTVEQLTLDFEYVINEVIRNDAAWSRQFCSFSDYDIVILEVCPETNQVVINIGLLLLAFPSPDEEGQLRPRTYHTSLKVAWDLNSGTFTTVGVGDLTEVKGQT
ncbi:DCA15 factor, partial [Thryothorus ludovicianus]|nr:DCA15 factor [Thryothorus ludovicianus]